MSALFLTSSGTEIGKTFVARMLLAQLRARGYECSAIKPVISGFDAESPEDSDSGLLLQAQGIAVDARSLDTVSPWRFSAPLSPDMAAERESRCIDYAELLEFCRQRCTAGITLIEGVGGVMVPLTGRQTVLDWIRDLSAPALLVVGSYLGSISHTLTAAAALRSAGVEIAGVVVNQSPVEPVETHDTARVLERHLGGPRCCVLPKKKAGDDFSSPDLVAFIAPYLNRR